MDVDDAKRAALGAYRTALLQTRELEAKCVPGAPPSRAAPRRLTRPPARARPQAQVEARGAEGADEAVRQDGG